MTCSSPSHIKKGYSRSETLPSFVGEWAFRYGMATTTMGILALTQILLVRAIPWRGPDSTSASGRAVFLTASSPVPWPTAAPHFDHNGTYEPAPLCEFSFLEQNPPFRPGWGIET